MTKQTNPKDNCGTTTSTLKRKQCPSEEEYTVYFAGDLWTHKDLIGNALLADFIYRVSKGRYRCILPQDLEEPVHRTVDIRNVDLKGVMEADMAIFNFDGANLDSGTVVEFIYAKMIDIPSVLLRTDFRSAGEGNEDQDPWNLMASHWPRAKVLRLHGMLEYQNARAGSTWRTVNKLYRKMAKQIVECLDEVRAEKPLASADQLPAIFDWAVRCPGAGYAEMFKKKEVAGLIEAKVARGLLASE